MKTPKKPQPKAWKYLITMATPKNEHRTVVVEAKFMSVNNRGDLILSSDNPIYSEAINGVAAFRCNSWVECLKGEPVFATLTPDPSSMP